MALSNITIPSFTSLIPVDTRTNNLKVLLLPTVSTNPGQFIMFKDYYGTASNSTFTISTTGTDYLDDINNRYTFSNAFGSMSFVSDGGRSWRTIGLYNGALTPAAPGSIIQPNLPATPLVYLIATLYSGSGTWFDSSPNGRNATLENGVIAKNAAGNGIVLNGSTNWVFPNVAAGNVWTLSAWYKNTGAIVGQFPCVVTQIYTGNPNVINIVLGYPPFIGGFGFWSGSWNVGTNVSMSNTNWTYFTGTWNGTTLITYVNGVAQGSNTLGSASQDAGTQYRIGRRWDAAEYVRGEIGEVRIYPIALTSNQVMTDYTYGAPFYTN